MSNTSNASKNVKRFLLLFALGIAYGFITKYIQARTDRIGANRLLPALSPRAKQRKP